ncbi:undecaprenyl diphosphate synthase [Methanophagales archaeon]|nr:undecaprenyl diphosphate synthase [Methanophagales archaeon]
MLNLLSYLYGGILKRRILNSPIHVKHVLLVMDETDLLSNDYADAKGTGMEKLRQFIKWCHGLEIAIISVYVGVIREGMDKNLLERAYKQLREEMTKALSKEKASITLYDDSFEPTYVKYRGEEKGNKEKAINISIGLGGRSELTKAIKEIVARVKTGELEPEAIDEKLLESQLTFKSEPDLVIRSGATRLADFLIWQSVYSEFYFTDVNWLKFRKIDLYRAVRDFQWRERRYGR